MAALLAPALLLILSLAPLQAARAQAGSTPVPVVFDTDMDFDDSAALAYLAAAHKRGLIELKAVTVTSAGNGYPGAAIRHARCILQRVGLPNIPVADSTATGANAFPPEARLAVQLVLEDVLLGCLQPTTHSAVSAPALLAQIANAEQGKLVLIATGPLTDVAAALPLLHPAPAGQEPFAQLYIMGGTIHAAGNLCCTTTLPYDNTQELNIWADPAAAQAVFGALGPAVSLVPLDATAYVPITEGYVGNINLAGNQATAEAKLVAAIVDNPIVQAGILDGMAYWWDPLAAVAAVQPGVVSYVPAQVSVVQSGAASGRVQLTPGGAPLRYATAANQAVFQQEFLDTLNER
jgi:inosine-uridine nucleoside N-ribohydrolase